jgi:hypothetical protein
MKCHLCDNAFEIKTDPENMQYVVVEGAKRQTEDQGTAEAPVGKGQSMLCALVGRLGADGRCGGSEETS